MLMLYCCYKAGHCSLHMPAGKQHPKLSVSRSANRSPAAACPHHLSPSTCSQASLLPQSLLCGVLQVVVQKLTETEASKAEVMRRADQGMEVLLAVLRSQQATVNEEALLAVGAYTYACGMSFQKYLEALMPFVLLGLQNFQVSCGDWLTSLSGEMDGGQL